MKFKLRHMEVFRAVMATGSISAAARALHTSQPALSKTISYLEQSLGLRLFTRTRSALIPTSEAQILFAEFTKVYNAVLEIDDLVSNLKAGQRARLAIGSSPSFALTLMPPAIEMFRQKFPSTQISFRTITMDQTSQEILGRRSDFVLSVLPMLHPNLTSTELFVGEVVCLMPKGHPLEAFDQIDLAQLADFPAILYDKSTLFGRIVREAIATCNVSVVSAIDVIRTEQACAFVNAGFGITLVSNFSVGSHLWRNITVRPLVKPILLPVTLVHSSFETLSPQAEAFVSFFKATAKHSGYAKHSR